MAPGAADAHSGGFNADPPPSGREKDAMHAFIRGNLNFILAPINESVRDLEDEVGVLKTDLAREKARGDLLEASKNENGPKIVELFERVSGNESRLDRAEEDVALLRREKSRLEADHEVTKASLSQAEDRLKAADERAEVFGLDLEALKASVMRMEFGLQETNGSLAVTNEHFVELKEFCEGLNKRHMDMVQDLKDLGSAGAATDRAVNKLEVEFAEQKAALAESEQRLAARASELNNMIEANSNAAMKRFDDMSSDITRLKALRVAFDSAERRIKQLEDNAAQASNERDSIQNELDMTKKEMVDFNKELVGQRTRFEEYRALNSDAMHKHDRAISDLAQEQLRHTRAIFELEKHTGELQDAQSRTQSTVDDLKRDNRKMQEWRTKEATVKIDMNTQGVQMNQGEIWKLNKEMGASKEDIQKLKDELAAANVVMAKLGSRFDVCSSQLQGISKGFQDTAQAVGSGTDGMIKPKLRQGTEHGNNDRTLPPLPGAECDTSGGFSVSGRDMRGSPGGRDARSGSGVHGAHKTGFLSARGAAF